MTPITEFAALRLKPGVSVTDDKLQTVFRNTIDTTTKASGTKSLLFQDTVFPEHLYLVAGWSSPEEQVKSLKGGIELSNSLEPFATIRFSRHVAVDVTDVPIDAPTISVETFTVGEGDEQVFAERAKAAEKTVSALNKGAIKPCGGFDIRPDTRAQYPEEFKAAEAALGWKQEETQEKKEEAEEKKEEATGDLQGKVVKIKTWVSFTGWKDVDSHVESAKEVTKGFEAPTKKVQLTPNVFDTVHMKKILE